MSRTSEDSVREVVDTVSTISIGPFIRAATVLVDRVEVCDADNLLSAEALREIETWLAAHFYSLRDQPYQSKSTQSASATFQGQTAMHLDSTIYGQAAMTMDFTGCLAEISKQGKTGPLKAGAVWLGRPPSEQTDYVDRD